MRTISTSIMDNRTWASVFPVQLEWWSEERDQWDDLKYFEMVRWVVCDALSVLYHPPHNSHGLHWTSLYIETSLHIGTNLDSTGLPATINTNLDSTGLSAAFYTKLDSTGLDSTAVFNTKLDFTGLDWTSLLYSTQNWTPLDCQLLLTL